MAAPSPPWPYLTLTAAVLPRLRPPFAAALPRLGLRFVDRVLHAAEPLEPLLCVRLYVWVARFGTHFARDASVRRALEDAL